MSSLKGVFKNRKIFSQLLLLLFLSGLFFYIGLAFWMVISAGRREDAQAIRVLQLIQSIGLFLIPPFIFAYLVSDRKPTEYLSLSQKINLKDVMYVILIMFIAIPFVNFLTSLNQQLVLPEVLAPVEEWMKQTEEEAALLTKQLLQVDNIGGLFANLILIALIPALGEELYFRGALQNVIGRGKGTHFAIWMTGFLFSAFHLQFYGLLPRWLLGVFFGYILVWSGNIWLPVIAHFTNNAIAVIFYYFSGQNNEVVNIDAVGTNDSWWMGVISLILTILLVFRIKSRIPKKQHI